MKHLKLYENWSRRTDDKEIIEVADYIDDILLDINDMDFPYVNQTFITGGTINLQINFEVSALSDNTITDDKFELTTEVFSIIERCNEYVESVGYKMDIYVRLDIIEGTTLGEQVDGQGSDNVNIEGLKKYIGREMHFIGVTIKKK